MKTINKNLYKIQDSDRKNAQDKNWNNTKNTYIGNLSEIAACNYLNIKWPASDGPTDITDDYGTRYQVKSTQEGFKKKRYCTFDITLESCVCDLCLGSPKYS